MGAIRRGSARALGWRDSREARDARVAIRPLLLLPPLRAGTSSSWVNSSMPLNGVRTPADRRGTGRMTRFRDHASTFSIGLSTRPFSQSSELYRRHRGRE